MTIIAEKKDKLMNGVAKWFLPLCLFVFSPMTAQAQVPQTNTNTTVEDDEDDDEDEDEDDDDVTKPLTQDEISVTDKAGNEELIEFPEAMTYDLDSLLSLYMSKTYLGLPGDCEMSSENPTFSKEEYIERLRRLPTVMEMAYNDIVQRFIDRYSGRLRYSVSYMLGAANFYLPIFEEALEAYQLPLELKYLPIIESALNPKAVSRCAYSPEPSDMTAVLVRHIEGVFDVEPTFIGFEPADKRITLHLRHSVAVTPKDISGVEVGTARLLFAAENDNLIVLQKVYDVAAI